VKVRAVAVENKVAILLAADHRAVDPLLSLAAAAALVGLVVVSVVFFLSFSVLAQTEELLQRD